MTRWFARFHYYLLFFLTNIFVMPFLFFLLQKLLCFLKVFLLKADVSALNFVASWLRTSKNVFSNVQYDFHVISSNLKFNLSSLRKESQSKFFIFPYVTVLGATYGKVVFIEVITDSWKSDEPVEKEVVFWKLWCLFASKSICYIGVWGILLILYDTTVIIFSNFLIQKLIFVTPYTSCDLGIPRFVKTLVIRVWVTDYESTWYSKLSNDLFF